ncbi:formate hydrogenlyase transcriptional activator [Oxobacter pfennigii]|uniref:HTH-type transcriptional regulatory protein TyrR n=1 Tax=Oxobacter pfennigii TaxID=36849 RepID=A0A0N8NTB2_9CLOT|nr:sigma 54-interacting transcriptional regulator [Oxobacter pfennigii]KPU44344.1 formate hydrogenlyase transcriptional activator [Oxobacter pfennigii]
MEDYVRVEVIAKDRVGITAEILSTIYKFNINLISVEVFPKRACIKMESIEEEKKESLKTKLYEIEDIERINDMELLPHEQSERRLHAIMDSVDEGIIAVDKNFSIEIFNSYCENVFHYKKDEVIGTDIRKLTGENAPVAGLIKNGREYDNIEYRVKNERGESHYLTTGRAVKDDKNRILGAVASIKDIGKAIELVAAVSSVEETAFKDIIGNSDLIDRVKKVVNAVAKSDSTVLFRGESGTGKELFAKALQNLSNRKNNRFITINCAALPENLLESELFGYEKGSFTGASSNGREGLFKEANNGTLFLDEIGELSLALQAKLLRVLQEGVIRKIGSNKEEKVDVRIIAATNRNLEKMIKDQAFREDLYYRLNVIPIYIPPLRERVEDIPLLVRFFIDRLNKRTNKKIKGADLDFTNKLMEYDWPGNVRELQNVIERSMNLCQGNTLNTGCLILNFEDMHKEILNDIKPENSLKLSEIVEKSEKEAIIRALNETTSIRKAAKLLGVSHTTIVNKIKKYDINWKE